MKNTNDNGDNVLLFLIDVVSTSAFSGAAVVSATIKKSYVKSVFKQPFSVDFFG